MTSVLEYNVGDRLLVSAMNRDTHKFDEDVFEVIIIEFSPERLYVKLFMFGVEGWVAYDKLKVREQLESKMSWPVRFVQ